MVRLAASEWNFEMTRDDIIEIEAQVIKLLDWELHVVGPIFFLERYSRIFGFCSEKMDTDVS